MGRVEGAGPGAKVCIVVVGELDAAAQRTESDTDHDGQVAARGFGPLCLARGVLVAVVEQCRPILLLVSSRTGQGDVNVGHG